MSKRTWYSTSANMKSGVVDIFIYDEIGMFGVSARDFAIDINAAINEGRATQVNVRINSPGGLVAEGLAIANTIKRLSVPVDTFIEGWCFSIATVVALAGKTRHMSDNSLFLIHNPSNFLGGTADDLRRHANFLDKVQSQLIQTYVQRSNLDEIEIQTAMDRERAWTSTEALEAGFIDTITGEVEAVANFDIDPERWGFSTLDKFYNEGPGRALARIPKQEDEVMPGKQNTNAQAPGVAPVTPIIETSPPVAQIAAVTGTTPTPATPTPGALATAQSSPAEPPADLPLQVFTANPLPDPNLQIERSRVAAIIKLGEGLPSAVVSPLIDSGAELAEAVNRIMDYRNANPPAAATDPHAQSLAAIQANDPAGYGANADPASLAGEGEVPAEQAAANRQLGELITIEAAKHNLTYAKASANVIRANPKLHAAVIRHNTPDRYLDKLA